MPGERRLITNTILTVGDHSVRIEAFICRKPDEDFEKRLPATCCGATAGCSASRTPSTTSATSTWSAGSRCTSVTPEVIDGILGQVLQAVDPDFNMLLELGFRSSIQKEWEWRVKRGESLKNLQAFEHLIDDDDDDDQAA